MRRLLAGVQRFNFKGIECRCRCTLLSIRVLAQSVLRNEGVAHRHCVFHRLGCFALETCFCPYGKPFLGADKGAEIAKRNKEFGLDK